MGLQFCFSQSIISPIIRPGLAKSKIMQAGCSWVAKAFNASTEWADLIVKFKARAVPVIRLVKSKSSARS
jgi:hypothetical protein